MIQRLLDDPFEAVDDMLRGVALAHAGEVELVGAGRAVRHLTPDPRRRTTVVIGGGSGHEPAFFGCLGRGLPDVAAVGNVFASPSAATVVEGVLAAGRDSALLVVGNYEGDIMNFTLAGELLAEHGVRTEMALMNDDVASSPSDRTADRRAVAGCIFVYKAVGAAADRGDDLDVLVKRFADVNGRIRTMGVGLDGCRLPTSEEPNFVVDRGTMAVGIGVHGEPGLATAPLATAAEVAGNLVERIVADGIGPGPVALSVNLCGATPLMEGYIVLADAADSLTERGFEVRRAMVGEFLTSLDMAGISVTVVALDDELDALLDAPAQPVAGPNPWRAVR